ncbi:2OG-Fe(II) oxygenase family protein [Actinoplanes sp. NPDC051475]|uniref:2OG-Fe(II) oxygenase family protein n=1 Tax=Actinoplanes sp. NPDC051475 TaxID=3157225 RepID=UPI00344F8D72
MAPAPALDVISLAGADDPRHRVAVMQRIARAGRELGGFAVTDHGVADDVIEEMYAATTGFFAQPASVKAQSAAAVPSRYQGWCTHALAGGSNTAETFAVSRFDTAAELAAANYTAADSPPPNLWPVAYPRLQAAWRPYLSQVHQLSMRLLDAAAQIIDAPPGWVQRTFTHHASGMIANWYPPHTRQDRLAQQPHTDFGALTILFQDNGAGGLEILDSERAWQPVPAQAGTLIVLFGDLMQRWSNGAVRALPHRVTVPPAGGPGRLSVPYFCHPHRNAPTTPLHDTSAPGSRAADVRRQREVRH